MKATLLNLVLLAVVGYVVYTYVINRESMTNPGTIGTAVGVVVIIVLAGVAYMYITSK